MTSEMLARAMRLLHQDRWPGDSIVLDHVMLLSFAYVFELDVQQEGPSVTWKTGQTLVARKSGQYITISGIRWFERSNKSTRKHCIVEHCTQERFPHGNSKSAWPTLAGRKPVQRPEET